jgi:tRNA(Ile)-lysidine synthase TilS/MesJ
MKICNRCILPETFPNIRFDSEGICNHCRQEESALAKSPARKAEYRQKLDNLIAASRDKAPAYDVIMAYSGGKDSSYTLKLLKERYDLRIITLTLDNHFVSPTAWDNIHTVVDNLGTDHISFRPSWELMRKLFRLTATEDVFSPATLLRASAMCTACIGIVKSLVLKTALEMSIPLVAFGWSPGQAPIQSAIMKTNPSLMQQTQKALLSGMPVDLSRPMTSYFLPPTYYDLYKDHFPHNIHPLAFFEYDEEKIKSELESIGWRLPTNTDTNSTNCLLNAFANQCHLDRHKFHPYVWEIANMVRQGVMSREEGTEKIYTAQNPDQVEYAKHRLGL